VPCIFYNSYLSPSNLVIASILYLVSSLDFILIAYISFSFIILTALIISFIFDSDLDKSFILFSLLSNNPNILLRFTLDNTSNSLDLLSNSSSLLLLVFLYYNSFYFSLPSFFISSLSLSIIFS